MKQVAQNYKSGELAVLDVPAPICRPGGVLVRSLFSLISTGTELMKVSEASMSMVGMARARPDQVKKVIDQVQQQGLVTTYKKVMNKLDSYTPLGYSLCGVVTEVGQGAEEFKVGQLVACAGNEQALHAEYNWIPVNLCAAVPAGVAPEHAAFATVASIAMHGVRRGEVQLGETAAVIGLGLIGQLVVRLLVAAGVQAIGIDPVPERCRLAEKAGAVLRVAGGPRCRAWRACQNHQRPGCGPCVPVRRRHEQRAGRGGREAGQGPGQDHRHRQDEAGPALERLLREGT
jgi:threonine dehydrogenase-like Zn-dependent dehydrogenase